MRVQVLLSDAQVGRFSLLGCVSAAVQEDRAQGAEDQADNETGSRTLR